MEIITPISNVSQEKLKTWPISRNTSTYIFKQDYSLVTKLSINSVSDVVVGSKIIVLLLPGNLVDFCISTWQLFFLCQWRLIWVSAPQVSDETLNRGDQGYRNFEIQIGPLDRWRHTNMSSTIPNSHENSSFLSKSVSEIDYFSDTVQLQPVVSKPSRDNPKSLA